MKDKKYSTFSNNLKYYMTVTNKDRNKICKDLGFNYTTVREWCNGTAFPRYDKIEKLANYFGINKADLIEEPKGHLINSAIRTSFLLTDYINNLARNELERNLLNDCTILIEKYQKIIYEQVQYYLDKQNEEIYLEEKNRGE